MIKTLYCRQGLFPSRSKSHFIYLTKIQYNLRNTELSVFVFFFPLKVYEKGIPAEYFTLQMDL